jgi:hypothetical protein
MKNILLFCLFLAACGKKTAVDPGNNGDDGSKSPDGSTSA